MAEPQLAKHHPNVVRPMRLVVPLASGLLVALTVLLLTREAGGPHTCGGVTARPGEMGGLIYCVTPTRWHFEAALFAGATTAVAGFFWSSLRAEDKQE